MIEIENNSKFFKWYWIVNYNYVYKSNLNIYYLWKLYQNWDTFLLEPTMVDIDIFTQSTNVTVWVNKKQGHIFFRFISTV